MTQPRGYWIWCDQKDALAPGKPRLRAKRKFGLSRYESVVLHRKRRRQTGKTVYDLAVETARRSRIERDPACKTEFEALLQRLRRCEPGSSRLAAPARPLEPGTRCFYIDRGPRGARAYGRRRVVMCRWRYVTKRSAGGFFVIFKQNGGFAAIPSQLVVAMR